MVTDWIWKKYFV